MRLAHLSSKRIQSAGVMESKIIDKTDVRLLPVASEPLRESSLNMKAPIDYIQVNEIYSEYQTLENSIWNT